VDGAPILKPRPSISGWRNSAVARGLGLLGGTPEKLQAMSRVPSELRRCWGACGWLLCDAFAAAVSSHEAAA
jgi:hypothetical protein